jgi:hypothetical protein
MKFLSTLSLFYSLVLVSACSTIPRELPKTVPKINVEKPTKALFIEAAKIPMYSVNLIREEIPEHLKAISLSYKAPKHCLEYRVELELLNDALGEDPIDRVRESDKVITLQLGSVIAREVESNIPFNSIIKSLSGAKKHEREVLAARLRGNARRSYLKGWAAAKPCA